jgi:hypothetical protein
MDGGGLALLGIKLPSEAAVVAGLREAAQSRSAFFAYALLAVCWTVLLARGQSLGGFGSAIEELPELQRAEILKRAYPSFRGKSLSSHDFIRSRQKRAWLFAVLALLVAVAVVAAIAIQTIDWQAARYS